MKLFLRRALQHKLLQCLVCAAILLYLLGACRNADLIPIDDQPTIEPSNTPAPVEANPTEVSETPTSKYTRTPIPTYPFDQAYQQLLSWLDDNGDCRLPCLWGFTPGKTDRQDIRILHSTFDNYYRNDNIGIWVNEFEETGGITLIEKESNMEINIGMSYNFMGEEHISLLGLHANGFIESESESERQIKDILAPDMLFTLVKEYTISSVLSNYGKPTAILIAPYFDERPEVPGPSWIWFSAVLIYENQGILAEYIMPRRMIGNEFAACVNQILDISIVTWDASNPVEFGKVASATSFHGISESFVDYFKSLEEATKLTIDEFTEIFQDPETDACIYTPMEMWPNP